MLKLINIVSQKHLRHMNHSLVGRVNMLTECEILLQKFPTSYNVTDLTDKLHTGLLQTAKLYG